jgi:hypothetical protein
VDSSFDEWIDELHATQRHPATLEKAQWFTYAHLPERLRPFSELSFFLARSMVGSLPDGPQLTLGLQKLIEAKDCFVRQATTAVQ